MTTRILRAAAAATMLLTLGATTMLAGGWATIVADDASPPQPRAGEDVEYGFTVLQHGETPAGFEDPTLRLTNTVSGETFDVPAEPSGPAGHFLARFTFPSAGSWSYGVQLQQLAVETQPVTGMVLGADGSAPAVAITRSRRYCGHFVGYRCARNCSQGSIASNATSVGSRSRLPPCGPKFGH